MVINHLFTQHEEASVAMFRHMLEDEQVRDEFETWKLSIDKHGKFIEELIMGEPDKTSSKVSILLHSQCQSQYVAYQLCMPVCTFTMMFVGCCHLEVKWVVIMNVAVV